LTPLGETKIISDTTAEDKIIIPIKNKIMPKMALVTIIIIIIKYQ